MKANRGFFPKRLLRLPQPRHTRKRKSTPFLKGRKIKLEGYSGDAVAEIVRAVTQEKVESKYIQNILNLFQQPLNINL